MFFTKDTRTQQKEIYGDNDGWLVILRERKAFQKYILVVWRDDMSFHIINYQWFFFKNNAVNASQRWINKGRTVMVKKYMGEQVLYHGSGISYYFTTEKKKPWKQS